MQWVFLIHLQIYESKQHQCHTVKHHMPGLMALNYRNVQELHLNEELVFLTEKQPPPWCAMTTSSSLPTVHIRVLALWTC